jgi:hypothetical protein
MTGPWKPWKTKSRFSTVSTAPWKSCLVGKISTFPQPGCAPGGTMENQKQVSHSSARSLPTRWESSLIQTEKQRKEVGRCAASSFLIFRITLYWKRFLISGSSLD